MAWIWTFELDMMQPLNDALEERVAVRTSIQLTMIQHWLGL